MSAKKFRIIISSVVLFGLSVCAYGQSARDFVNRGNSFYAKGRYSEAVGEYDQALVEGPELLEPKFNKANSFFRLDDLVKAIELYREVAAGSKDMELVTRAKYNLGNSYFQRGGKQKDSDLQKAVENFLRSIQCWRWVLDIDPENINAAKNIEVARLTIKDINDQLNKQRQAQQAQQKKRQELIEKLKELLERQKTLSQQNQSIQDKAAQGGIPESQTQQDYQDLAGDQLRLKNETQEAIEKLNQDPTASQEGGPVQQAQEELAQAVSEQTGSVEKLSQLQTEEAKGSQDKAAEHIENAVKALTEQDQQQQQQQQDQEQQQQEQEQDRQQQTEAPDSTAEEILEKEEKDRKARQILRTGQIKVDKDW